MNTVLNCGHEPTPDEFTGGYGKDADGKTFCYACCAERDRANMRETGRAVLYLVMGDKPEPFLCSWPRGRVDVYRPCKVTNWPDSLSYQAVYQRGRHNIAGVRYDVWFTDCDGAKWHGVTYGDNTQLCHCRRLKTR